MEHPSSNYEIDQFIDFGVVEHHSLNHEFNQSQSIGFRENRLHIYKVNTEVTKGLMCNYVLSFPPLYINQNYHGDEYNSAFAFIRYCNFFALPENVVICITIPIGRGKDNEVH